MNAAALFESDFATLPDLVRAHASERGAKIAVADDRATLTYAQLDHLMDRVAAGLQRDNVSGSYMHLIDIAGEAA